MGFNHSGGYEELLAAFPRSITPRDVAGDEHPRHGIRITRPFELAMHEVTVGQFRAFCEATGYRTTAETSGEGIVGFAPIAPEETERLPEATVPPPMLPATLGSGSFVKSGMNKFIVRMA